MIGRLDAPGFFTDPAIRSAWLKSEWYGQTKISLDPKKDAEDDAQDLTNCTKTREQIVQERTGGDVESKIEQLGRGRAVDQQGRCQACARRAEPRRPAAFPAAIRR